MPRQLKNFMKARKRGWCKCLAISRWRCGDYCNCAWENSITIFWIRNEFIMPYTNESWRVFANGSYIAVSNDNWLNYYYIADESDRSWLPAQAEYEYVIVDESLYNTLSWLIDKLGAATDEYWVDAKTATTSKETNALLEGYRWTTKVSLYFNWDWEWDTSKPSELVFDVLNFRWEKLWKMSLTSVNGKAMIYVWEDDAVLADYVSKIIAQPNTNILIDYRLSLSIRDLFDADIVDSVIVSWVIRVHSDEDWLYDLSIDDNSTPYVFTATAWDNLPWVTEWTSKDLSSEAVELIYVDWYDWVYISQEADLAIQWELSS